MKRVLVHLIMGLLLAGNTKAAERYDKFTRIQKRRGTNQSDWSGDPGLGALV